DEEGDGRDRDVDEENDPPGRDVDQPAAEGGADDERDPGPGRPQPDRVASRGAAEGGSEHRERSRSEKCARDALDAAEDDERWSVRGDRAKDRGAREARDPEREDPNLAEDVPERPADEDERAEGEQVGVHDPLLRGEPAAEVVLDRGQRDVDNGAVDEGHRRSEDARDDRPAADPHGGWRGGLHAFHRAILWTAVGVTATVGRPPRRRSGGRRGRLDAELDRE